MEDFLTEMGYDDFIVNSAIQKLLIHFRSTTNSHMREEFFWDIRWEMLKVLLRTKAEQTSVLDAGKFIVMSIRRSNALKIQKI